MYIHAHTFTQYIYVTGGIHHIVTGFAFVHSTQGPLQGQNIHTNRVSVEFVRWGSLQSLNDII